MHPAYSVIFFTVASGAGFGLLAVISAGILLLEWHPSQPGATGIGVAMLLGSLLAIAGLLSSTFHLGHPERAWRALSQWRSSWLSREGVLAIAAFIPIVVMTLGWWMPSAFSSALPLASAATLILVVATVFCTAMIYTSLKTIPNWHKSLVAPVYLLFAVSSGALLALLFIAANASMLVLAGTLLIASWVCKTLYWKTIDHADPVSTIESATGLGELGAVRTLDPPHTSMNYVQKEMGFAIARKHAMKLRRFALGLGLVLPTVLLVGAWLTSGALQMLCLALAAVGLIVSLLIERWLFFAEAKHVVTLFYGASRV